MKAGTGLMSLHSQEMQQLKIADRHAKSRRIVGGATPLFRLVFSKSANSADPI
jgi:hypothetical protein